MYRSNTARARAPGMVHALARSGLSNRCCSAGASTEQKPAAQQKYNLKVEGKPFTVGQGQLLAVLGASLPLLFRLGMGTTAAGYKGGIGDKPEGQYAVGGPGNKALIESSKVSQFKRPEKPLIMYEFDACPFCKKVREMCTYLDLDCEYRPCPQGSPNHRPEAVGKSGKSRFPFMEDPNTGRSMLESDDIIQYLADTYGDGTVPFQLKLGMATVLTAGLGTLGRAGKGGRYRNAKRPAQPLTIWGYEASPFVRLVRERLTELEIPHVFKTCARGSPTRHEMFEAYGKFQVPLLEDPNTGTAMFESGEIVKYLESEYAQA